MKVDVETKELNWNVVPGEKIVHFFVMSESQRKYLDDYFYGWLSNRKYPTSFPANPKAMVRPRVREIRFYDISIPECNKSFLLTDLAPFNLGGGELTRKLNFLFSIVRKVFGLKPVGSSKRNVRQNFRDFVDVFVLGEKEDEHINGCEMI